MATRRFVRAQAPAFNSRRSWRSVEAAREKPAGLFVDSEGDQEDGAAGDAKLWRHTCEEGMASDGAAAGRRLLATLFFAVMIGSGKAVMIMVMDGDASGMGMRRRLLRLQGLAIARMGMRLRHCDREDRNRQRKAECPKDSDQIQKSSKLVRRD